MTTFPKSNRAIILGIIGITIVVLVGHILVRNFFDRTPFLLLMYGDFQNYADDHNNWFPQSGRGPYDALQILYPEYTAGQELAGLSGNISSVVERLKMGKPLTTNLTSWIYIQGLKTTDNPKIAILWESRGGIYANGARDASGGHTVLLLNGEAGQISGFDWTNFLAQQEQLRKTAFEDRKGVSQ